MSVWAAHPPGPSLAGIEGELVSVRIAIEPRYLEELLEALAEVSFPINPEIHHGRPTEVDFPAYETRLGEMRKILGRHDFDDTCIIEVTRMVDRIRG
ncbi:MAG: hypothetical protein HYZ57_19330 [Acidobacteria bacterium]|nr:hypothetical protein [Acidobacteriota bacterium]MBI3281982.1 hypothetical protein [Acidobacteriota bacterium]